MKVDWTCQNGNDRILQTCRAKWYATLLYQEHPGYVCQEKADG